MHQLPGQYVLCHIYIHLCPTRSQFLQALFEVYLRLLELSVRYDAMELLLFTAVLISEDQQAVRVNSKAKQSNAASAVLMA